MRIQQLSVVAVLLVSFSSTSFAGLTRLTHHSRANCVTNESISWDGLRTHDLAVTSQHYPVATYGGILSPSHLVETGALRGVFRAAAIHWGEGVAGLPLHYVRGHHWLALKITGTNSYRTIYRNNFATGCNITEGFF